MSLTVRQNTGSDFWEDDIRQFDDICKAENFEELLAAFGRSFKDG